MPVAVIDSQYNCPINTLVLCLHVNELIIDGFEFYEKKSFRNRCYICDSHGKFRLTVPLQGSNSSGVIVNNVKVDTDQTWQREHWQSIVSAYNRSPFFEFYADEIEEIYQSKYKNLIELNRELFQFMLERVDLDVNVQYSQHYIEPADVDFDYRSVFLPNNKSKQKIEWPSYLQVFSDRLPFVENLSSLDLLFNQGPQARAYLEQVSFRLGSHT